MSWLKSNWWWIAAALAVIALLLMFNPAGLFWWNYVEFNNLLRDQLGFGASMARVGAVVLGIAFALTLPIAGRWILFGRRRIEAIAAAIFVLATPPLLHALFETNFNQSDQNPQVCYVWHQDGQLVRSETLSGKCGVDPDTGQIRRLLTPEVARIWERMKGGIRAKAIEGDPAQIEFFDPVTGNPKIWYDRRPAGQIQLYDAEGFSPQDGSLLKPITRDIIDELFERKRASDEEEKKQAQAEAKKQELAARQAAEVARKTQAENERDHARQSTTQDGGALPSANGGMMQPPLQPSEFSLPEKWHGSYFFNDGRPPGSFRMEVRVANGTFEGQTDNEVMLNQSQHALVTSGRISGRRVSWLKTYDGRHGADNTVQYQGELNLNGSEITGTWTTQGISGTFVIDAIR